MKEDIQIDYDVIMSALDGNRVSLGYILEAFTPFVEKVLKTLNPKISDENLQDCKQEVFILLIRVIPKFRLKLG
ncbi:MAG: helix-turn-helix domain-containing protein [Lachnospiraceae bacterium]|nr:helix-turn-helix domain-containing protein [Lachnospiraceae bacterium]